MYILEGSILYYIISQVARLIPVQNLKSQIEVWRWSINVLGNLYTCVRVRDSGRMFAVRNSIAFEPRFIWPRFWHRWVQVIDAPEIHHSFAHTCPDAHVGHINQQLLYLDSIEKVLRVKKLPIVSPFSLAKNPSPVSRLSFPPK